LSKDSGRDSIALAVAFVMFACSVARAQPATNDDTIVGPPSESLRQTIAAAARDYLRDLPAVKGSEISNEMAAPGARKLHAVCVRWKSKEVAGSPVYVTLAGGLPESAWKGDERCYDTRLNFFAFPEMQ